MRRLPRFVFFAVVILGAAVASGQTPLDLAKVREVQQKALECHGRKEWACFLERAREAQAMDSASTRLLYILACAEARNGDAAGAARHLNELLDRKVGWQRGDDLVDIREKPEMAPVLAKLAALKAPVSKSSVAFRLEQKDLIPEGIAFDSKSRAFFFGSVHHRKVVRRAADGTVTDFVPEARDGLGAVLALRVDNRRGVLWACSAPLPEMRGFQEELPGNTALWAFDLTSGRRVLYLPLEAAGKHALNDIGIAPNGDVWTTDSLAGGIYRLKAGPGVALDKAGPLEEVVAPGLLRSAQGLAFSADGKVAYVSDWGEGIFLLDPATARLERMAGPADVPLAGVDALVASGKSLFVTQNGIYPARVAKLTLDASGRRVVRGEILEMSSPQMAEPTLGVFGDGGDFYFIANGQWDAFDAEKKQFPAEKLKDTVILKVSAGKKSS
jgi:hypothetical protein